jgi:hypothetical protein
MSTVQSPRSTVLGAKRSRPVVGRWRGGRNWGLQISAIFEFSRSRFIGAAVKWPAPENPFWRAVRTRRCSLTSEFGSAARSRAARPPAGCRAARPREGGARSRRPSEFHRRPEITLGGHLRTPKVFGGSLLASAPTSNMGAIFGGKFGPRVCDPQRPGQSTRARMVGRLQPAHALRLAEARSGAGLRPASGTLGSGYAR